VQNNDLNPFRGLAYALAFLFIAAVITLSMLGFCGFFDN
jgi:hypothetical protein